MKKILVTGMSRNIGKAICERLVRDGYYVVGTYKDEQKEAEEIIMELKHVEIHQVDFSDRPKLLEFLEKIKGNFFHAVINNAGVIEFELFDDLTLKNWDYTLAVNLNAPLTISHALRNSIVKGGGNCKYC